MDLLEKGDSTGPITTQHNTHIAAPLGSQESKHSIATSHLTLDWAEHWAWMTAEHMEAIEERKKKKERRKKERKKERNITSHHHITHHQRHSSDYSYRVVSSCWTSCLHLDLRLCQSDLCIINRITNALHRNNFSSSSSSISSETCTTTSASISGFGL